MLEGAHLLRHIDFGFMPFVKFDQSQVHFSKREALLFITGLVPLTENNQFFAHFFTNKQAQNVI